MFSFSKKAMDLPTPSFWSGVHPNTYWDSASVYVTPKGMPVIYSMEENIRNGGRMMQVYNTHNFNYDITTLPTSQQTVTNCNDYGPGSLREAILNLASTIVFAPAIGCSTINLLSPLEISVHDVSISAANLPNGMRLRGDGVHRILETSPWVKVTIDSLTFTNGSTPEDPASYRANGGAILNLGTLTISNSTISGNHATHSGGGIANLGGVVKLYNVTIANNTATDFGGAGIANYRINLKYGMVSLYHTTVAGNSVGGRFPGAGITNLADMIIENSIVAGNTTNDGAPSDVYTERNITTPTKNIIMSVYGIGGYTLKPDGRDPLLNPLGNYGGTTQTMSLPLNSPARDAAGPDSPGAARLTDQRGLPRKIGAAADLGAVETLVIQTFPTPNQRNIKRRTPTLTWTGVPGAVFAVYVDTGGGLTMYKTTTDSFYTLAAFLPTNFQAAWRVDTILNGKIYTGELLHFTTRGPLVVTTEQDENDPNLGQGTGDSLREAIADAVPNEVITFDPKFSGGGVTLKGTPLAITSSLTIDASAVARRWTIDGGGLSQVLTVGGQISVTLKNLILSGGAGDYGAGLSNQSGTVTLVNCIIQNNHAPVIGGGIYSKSGNLTLKDSSVQHNSAGTFGGGMLIDGGIAQIQFGDFSFNTAGPVGGFGEGEPCS